MLQPLTSTVLATQTYFEPALHIQTHPGTVNQYEFLEREKGLVF